MRQGIGAGWNGTRSVSVVWTRDFACMVGSRGVKGTSTCGIRIIGVYSSGLGSVQARSGCAVDCSAACYGDLAHVLVLC